MCHRNELKPSDLRCACDPRIFDFASTAELEPLDEVIGQTRAVQAIEFGLNMKSPGYNIFVTGHEGTGKSTIVKDIVQKHAETQATPNDWCLVNNFKDEYRPLAIRVPAGKSIKFRRQINRVISDLKAKLSKEFEDESYLRRKSALEKKYSERRSKLLENLDQFAQARMQRIQRTTTGLLPVALIDGKPISPEEFQQLPEAKRAEIEENIRVVQEELESTAREIGRLRQLLQTDIEKLMAEVASFVLRNRLSIIKEEYKDFDDIVTYLNALEQDIVENAESLVERRAEKPEEERRLYPLPPPALQKYSVNVLVDRGQKHGAPVVFESNPTYQNLFGRIEKRAFMGVTTTDFTMVQAGSLLQADGGFLILEIEAVLMNASVWEALKRALLNKRVHIEDVPAAVGYSSASLRPEPIPIDVTVILLGSYDLFQRLQNFDSKFNKIFKVRADFDNEVERNNETVRQYALFIARVCRDENLLPFTPEGVAAIVEYGEKFIANKDKLSLRFGQVVGIIKEADYWARKSNATLITDQHVVKAFTEYRFRYNLYEEKIHEAYVDETILIDIDGVVVGQVNGLVVHQIGDISFGRPSRITAETYMGRPHVINIEREAKLSGRTHDKGVLILTGYLGRTFAQNYPLTLTISLALEQSYGGVEGDSASSAELFAILSSLSGIPINQGIAVTGSVNQKGKIQAIGGVNQKTEGFFDVCKEKGLTGSQGVLIPKGNLKNLMLKKSVIDAVKEGKFHIYQIGTVEEGIEILTGIRAGEPDSEGTYPEDTVYGKVQKKLQKYLERSVKLKSSWGHEDHISS